MLPEGEEDWEMLPNGNGNWEMLPNGDGNWETLPKGELGSAPKGRWRGASSKGRGVRRAPVSS